MECDCFAGMIWCLAILNDGPSCFGADRKDGVDVIFFGETAVSNKSISELKARNEFYKKGSIIPQRVLKTERKKKHHVTFGSDTWLVPTRSGYLCICDTGKHGSAINITGLKNAHLQGSPYGGSTQWVGNTYQTDEQHNAYVLELLAKLERHE